MKLLEPLEIVKLAAARGKSRSKTSVRFDIASGRLALFGTTGRGTALITAEEAERYVAGLA